MPAVVSPTAGTRIEPTDGYIFIRGTSATFKITFTNNGIPIVVDTGTIPLAKILEPVFLNAGGQVPVPNVLVALQGALVPGQQYEYEFIWNIPPSQIPLDQYVISYEGTVANISYNFGDEFFTITHGAGQLGVKIPSYATVDDVRAKKFNIDDYLPKALDGAAATVITRNNLIEKHLRDATTKLREELNLSKSRGNSDNFRLFCVYYTVWSILLASRGEDGSSVSDANLSYWRGEWNRILEQEKRESVFQGIPLGRG